MCFRAASRGGVPSSDGTGEVAMRVCGIGKRFRIDAPSPYWALQAGVTNLIRDKVSWTRRSVRMGSRVSDGRRYRWALRGVDLELRRGEIVGLVGRNGSGKSVLLRILSGVTKPTEGYAEIFGRISSALEVGAGFDHELTGTENVHFVGTVLGMKEAEIRARLDEISAFFGVEGFMDTPTKTYSSGMQSRLTFSIVAFLSADILLLDEIMAVGDLDFSKKCRKRIQELSEVGHAVLIVSHDLTLVEEVCHRAVWLQSGSVRADGDARSTLREYREGSNCQP